MGLLNAVIDAPSNLGLRPPMAGVAPGCYKMPWALRNAGLIKALKATDLGCVVPSRYDATWQPGQSTRNSEAIAIYSAALASHLQGALDRGFFPIVVGGDCSILLGAGLALKSRGTYGLLFVDGHTDFRHPGNSDKVDAAAGEDLAISVGLGDPRLVDLSGLGPNFHPRHVASLGARSHDPYLDELNDRSIFAATSQMLLDHACPVLDQALAVVTAAPDGFWVHVDVDVVDSGEMFAVDSPEPEGISFADLSHILSVALSHDACMGMDVTIYDPDLDPEGLCAPRIVRCLGDALARRQCG